MYSRQIRSRHITKFGSPLAGSRALYFVSDQDGLIQMDIDLELEQLRQRGRIVTRDIETKIKENVKTRKREYDAAVAHLGIPDYLKNLFEVTSKSEAEQHIQKITIPEYELFLLIHNCNQIGFTHRAKFRQYVPEHLKLSSEDREVMKATNPKKFFKKMDAGLAQRKYVHVHLFERSSDWHCFYFRHQDIEHETDWKYGSHLHYLSHLWTLNKRWVWSKFNKRRFDISGIHIKFEPFDFSKLDEAESSADVKKELPPQLVIFDPTLAKGLGSIPLPVAHLATRGAWITTVSFRSS